MEVAIPKVSQDLLASRFDARRSRVKPGFVQYSGGLRIHSSLLRVVAHD